MEVLKLIFYAMLALFILVTFHEFGHFWVARKCGVRVLKFSIGFGRPIVRWQKGHTEYILAMIPLGGYVKMYGELDDEQGSHTEFDLSESFSHKSVWQRMAIVVAGPMANFLLAILFYWVIFLSGTQGVAPVVGEIVEGSAAEAAGMVSGNEITSIDGVSTEKWADVYAQLMKRIGETGTIAVGLKDFNAQLNLGLTNIQIKNWNGDTDEPQLLASLGIEPYRPPIQAVVGSLTSGGAAESAGLQVDDEILEVSEVSIKDWNQWRDLVRNSPEKELVLKIKRSSEIFTITMVPATHYDKEQGTIGLAGVEVQAPTWPDAYIRDRSYSIFEAFGAAVSKTADTSVFILDSLKKLLTGQVSTKSLGGPVAIAQIAGASADAGWIAFVSFLAIMSVMLGVMNLLPIPVLDGGHLLFYIIEAIKGSPLNEAIQNIAIRAGMTIVFGIMLIALYNDFARL